MQAQETANGKEMKMEQMARSLLQMPNIMMLNLLSFHVDETYNQVDKLRPPEKFGHPDTSFDSNLNSIDEGGACIMENDRSHKRRLCKMFNAKGSCPFGDECVFIHDAESRSRESTAIVLVAGYRNVGVTRSGGPAAAAPLPSRPPALSPVPLPATPPAVPLTQAVNNDTVKPMNWRTRICRSWELAGYCPFGNKCFFAHGEAELQELGGPEANPNNQRATFPNVVAAARSSVARVVGASGSSADGAAGSEQLPGGVQRRISKWPVGINRIYGDWIDDSE